MGNDFAEYQGKTYISFPPFPAVLMLPFVALAGSPEDLRDGQLMVWLAGVGPAVLFLVLEKVRRRKLSERSERENVALSFLLAFGTVYFFTAVEGTVWFAAHVVGVALAALYLLFARSSRGCASRARG
jgi:4-amino-4-deoxy-L-arabinose transferase-like glycosyltransferase